jgi:hypothetical protein
VDVGTLGCIDYYIVEVEKKPQLSGILMNSQSVGGLMTRVLFRYGDLGHLEQQGVKRRTVCLV